MRAVVVTQFGGPEHITVIEAAVPQPGPREVLVRVAAAALHPTDQMLTAGLYVEGGAAGLAAQYGVGVDLAGTVEAVGSAVSTVEVGAAVIGIQERLDQAVAAQADHVLIEEWAVAPAPAGVPMEQAAGIPLNGLTAFQALEALAVPVAGWILVTGAAGGVGSLAIELAKVQGLRVVAQARATDEAAVRRRGAELFVAADQPLGPTVRGLVDGGVHAALDAANLGVPAMDAVRHGGAYVSLLNSAPQSRREVRTINLAYHTDRRQLGILSGLAAAGLLNVSVARTYPLEAAQEAHRHLASGHSRGLVVLVP